MILYLYDGVAVVKQYIDVEKKPYSAIFYGKATLKKEVFYE